MPESWKPPSTFTFDPAHVRLDKAEADIVHDDKSRYFSLDLMGGAKAMVLQWWSAQTRNGAMGDTTLADANRGKAFFEVAVEEIVGLIREIRCLSLKKRKNHHERGQPCRSD